MLVSTPEGGNTSSDQVKEHSFQSTMSHLEANKNTAITVTEMAKFTVMSCLNHKQYQTTGLVTPRITVDLPVNKLDTSTWNHLRGIQLADPTFHLEGKIDMLIGAELFYDILQDGKHVGPKKVPRVTIMSKEDQLCEDHFLKTFKRNEKGRYVVQFPFKETPHLVNSYYDVAVRRLAQMERSALICNEKSLNDMLHCCHKLQRNILRIITRFRMHRYFYTADIRQMFRQINIRYTHRTLITYTTVIVHSDDQCYQGIVRQNHPSEPIKQFKLKTVTYSLITSPFNALRTLAQLAVDEQNLYHVWNALLNVLFWIRIAQHSLFSDEIKRIKSSKLVATNYVLDSLDPFIDNKDLLRVAGRFWHANISYAILNIRPLCELDDGTVLTPGHFIIGHPLLAVLEDDIGPIDNHRKRWNILQKITQTYWKQWSNDLAVGDTGTPTQWPMAHVLEVFTNPVENRVGVVRIRTSKTELIHPITKLVKLSIEH
ncbi:DUF5641 domain-containing protein [Aphis craccivora]|uniref:DUF5641 domain-containing protein n=1 Tax=Aphis craccivora TaxID=307492 RepID=A0A6G0XZY4_APHCR|nr:DUF5641 domain-containing protein [Aphis craccivora]